MIPPQICFTSLSQAEISFVQNVSARKKKQTKPKNNQISSTTTNFRVIYNESKQHIIISCALF